MLLIQIWEQLNFDPRMNVPRLNALAHREGGEPAPIDLPAVPLAAAVVTLDVSSSSALVSAGDVDAEGEMEVLLTGRAGLDKDFCVRFLYRIAIW